jgi:broad specificity phosphatase PhoE
VRETEFVLIRHAESTWKSAERWQGQGDPALSAIGRRQAAALAHELEAEGIEVLIASDLARAAETAAILGAQLRLEHRTDPRLRELDVGTWTGLNREQIARSDPELLARFESGDPDARAGDAESRRRIRCRVRRAAAAIAGEHAGRCVALVTHLGAIRALLPGAELDNAEWRRARVSEMAPPQPEEGGG